jgi:hypothetical protein
MLRQGRKRLPAAVVGIETHELAAVVRVQRPMHRHQMRSDVRLERQCAHELQQVRPQLLLRPGDGARCGARKRVQPDLAGNGAVVISGHPNRVGGPQQADAFGRAGVEADHVAETHDAVDILPGDGLQRRYKRFDVGVDVGDEC